MASIPLPALSVRPPAQPQDPLEQYGKIVQMKSLLAEQQQRQQMAPLQMQAAQENLKGERLKNQQTQHEIDTNEATADAFKSAVTVGADGTPTYDKAAITKALSAKGYGDKIPDIMKGFTQMDESAAKLRSAQADAETKTQEYIANGARSIRDAGYDPHVAQSVFAHIAAGMPSAAGRIQEIQQAVQQNPGALKQLVDTAINSASAESRKNASEEAKNTATLPGIQSENIKKAAEAGVAPQMATLGVKEKKTLIAKNQVETAQAAASTAKAKLETEYLKNAPAGLQGVQPHLVSQAANAYAKTGEEYASSKETSDNMAQFMKEARSGNKAAVKIIPLEGALQIVTAQGVHRINRTEVDQYGGAGSLYDKIKGKIGGAASGKDIPNDVLDDMETMQQTISQNAANLHANKVKVINKTFGSHFEPMDFSAAAAGGESAASGGGAGGYWDQFPVHK